MADTVGSYSLSEFTTPATNAKPISSATLRGNFNALQAKLVAHDADAGLHVQHVASGGLPGTGTASHATWLTTDTKRVYLDLTNLGALSELAYLPAVLTSQVIANNGTGTLITGPFVGTFVVADSSNGSATIAVDTRSPYLAVVASSPIGGGVWQTTAGLAPGGGVAVYLSGGNVMLENRRGASLTWSVAPVKVL